MDRTAFEGLYLHAHSLADLALLRAMQRVLDAPPPELTDAQRAANAAEAERIMNVSADDFDWSALEGLDAAPEAAPIDEAAAALPTFGAAVDFADDGPPDLTRYAAAVAAARGLLQARIDHCWALADPAALAAALARLPAVPHPITAAPTADSLALWLEPYEQEHDGLLSLVLSVRQLEPLF